MMIKVAPRIHLEGELAEHPFPRVLQYLHERNVTGRLLLTRGKLSKEVFIVEGNPVNVNSNLRDETLGRFLVKAGKISEEQYEESVRLMIAGGIQQGAALVQLGALSPKALYHEVKEQTRTKLLTCFAWPEGEFSFTPGVDFIEDIYRFEMSVPQQMHDGITRYFPENVIVRELVRARPGPILPVPGFMNVIADYQLDENESAFVMTIDGEKDLAGLQDQPTEFFFASHLLYLLLVCGLIGPDGQPDPGLRAIGDQDLAMPPVESFIGAGARDAAPEPPADEEQEAPPAMPGPAATEPPAIELEEPEPPLIAPPDEVAGPNEDDVLLHWKPVVEPEPVEAPPEIDLTEPPDLGPIESEPEDTATPELAGPPEIEGPSDETEPAASEEEEELVLPARGHDLSSRPEPGLVAAPPEELRDESEILEYYMVCKNFDFYTLLQLNRDAGDAEVDNAYHTLRSKYYRNQFAPEISAEALDKLEEIHAQIIRAYEALRTEAGRRQYLAELEQKPERPVLTDTLQAEQCLQRGMAAVRKRDWVNAQAMFEQAVAANPRDPEYKGYLGWTIYSNTSLELEARREQAKAILREALQINPSMDSAHVFLGKILKEEGKVKEAVNEFDLALLCNPKCGEAERELAKHEQKEW
jgi:hypothetical protein